MNRPATSNYRRQQGALTVITPLLLVIVVILSVMALDGARLYMLRGEMQAQVNVAAQAAAGEAQSCGGQFVSTAVIQARALAAAKAQGFSEEDGSLQVQVGLIEDGDDSDVLSFRPVNFVEESNAVLVTYTRSEPISLLLPESTFGTLDMSVNAAARREVIATLSAGGSTATVGPGILGGLLGAILGDPGFVLDPTSLDSLRNTTVEVGDLLTELGVASVADALDLDGSRLAGALSNIAGSASPLGNTLDNLLTANGIGTVKVSDVLEVVEGTQVPTDSEFPLYDMVISLVLNVAETQQDDTAGFLGIPLDLNINLAPLASIETDLDLHVGEAPKIVVGPARQDADGEWRTRFYAPDISLLVTATVDVLSAGPVGVANITLPLAVNAGGAHGDFVSADCATGTSNEVEIGVRLERSVALLASGSIDPGTGVITKQPVTVRLLNLIPILLPSLNVEVSVEGEVPGVTSQVVVTPDYPLYCDAISGCEQHTYEDLGSGVAGLDLDVEVDEVSLGPLELTGLLKPITNFLNVLLEDVVEALAGQLINPLLQTLGLGLGGASVTVTNASQGNSQLIENIEVAAPGQ